MARADDDATAGEVVVDVVAHYAGELPALERAAVADDPDGVHQARILVRRLRSVLGSAERLFADERVGRLRGLLEGLGDELGEVRDLEVRIRHAEEHVGPGAHETVVDRLIVRERARYREAHDDLLVAISESGAAHEALAAFVADPPYDDSRSEQSAEDGIVALIRHDLKRVRRAERRALGDLDSLHTLRRRARRLRYLCEAFTEEPMTLFGGGGGADVVALGAAAKGVQDVLGDHRDALLFALQVRRAEAAAREAGEPLEDYARIADDAFAAATERMESLPEAFEELHERAAAFD